jgi:nitrate reductase gamma subunit/cytochrome c553
VKKLISTLGLLMLVISISIAQTELKKKDVYGSTSCMGCHGMTAMGGLGPPLAQTKLEEAKFLETVRNGKGMMPGTPIEQLSDEDAKTIYDDVKARPWNEEQIPIAFKVGALLTTKNVAKIFLAVSLFSFIFMIRGIVYWVKLAGFKYMKPALRRFGYGKALGVALNSLLFDGLFVQSLWRKSKHLWAMHGLMLYGMIGLATADVLMQIFNPTRADLALSNPLKVLPIAAGVMVLLGIGYVMKRYKTDEYIDNGLTLGRDYLFVFLLFQTVLSGIFTLVINRTTAFGWVMPIYIYHLASVCALIVSAPFTRFQHAWIVPIMVSLTKITEAVTNSGVEIGFLREPSPGRHHKSLRIAEDVVARVYDEPAKEITIRYYP